MSKGEILDLLYESDHKKFYSDSLCLQKAGSYLKTETCWSNTPQVIFYDGYGKRIGEALEYNEKAHFYGDSHRVVCFFGLRRFLGRDDVRR